MFAAALIFGFGLFCLTAWAVWYFYRLVQKRRQQRAHRLATYLRRLQPVVGQLLHQANELDQASKYSGLDRDAQWTKKYGDALNKLLEANTKLEETNIALVEQELGAAQDCLLYVIRTIHIVSYRLREMEPVVERIELKAELKMEQTRAAYASAEETSLSSTSHPGDGANKAHVIDINKKADEHSVLKMPEQKGKKSQDDSAKN